MIVSPKASELRSALDAFDRQGATADGRHAFLSRVADNARALLEREAVLGEDAEAGERERLSALLGVDGGWADLNRALCEGLAKGRVAPRDPALLAHLRATAIARIAIDQPAYCGLEALLEG